MLFIFKDVIDDLIFRSVTVFAGREFVCLKIAVWLVRVCLQGIRGRDSTRGVYTAMAMQHSDWMHDVDLSFDPGVDMEFDPGYDDSEYDNDPAMEIAMEGAFDLQLPSIGTSPYSGCPMSQSPPQQHSEGQSATMQIAVQNNSGHGGSSSSMHMPSSQGSHPHLQRPHGANGRFLPMARPVPQMAMVAASEPSATAAGREQDANGEAAPAKRRRVTLKSETDFTCYQAAQRIRDSTESLTAEGRRGRNRAVMFYWSRHSGFQWEIPRDLHGRAKKKDRFLAKRAAVQEKFEALSAWERTQDST